jgi:hypothetical protein
VQTAKGGGCAWCGGGEVASIGTGQIKAKELDSPLSWGVGVVGGIAPTAGAGSGRRR